VHDLLGEPALLAELGRTLARFLVQGREGRVLHVERHHLFGRHDDRREMPFLLPVVEGRGPLFTLEQELYATQSALDLPDAGDHTGAEENVRGGFLGVVPLRDREHETVTLERRFDGAEGARPARRNRRGDSGEHDRPTQRKDGKCLALTHMEFLSKGNGALGKARSAPSGLRHHGRNGKRKRDRTDDPVGLRCQFGVGWGGGRVVSHFATLPGSPP